MRLWPNFDRIFAFPSSPRSPRALAAAAALIVAVGLLLSSADSAFASRTYASRIPVFELFEGRYQNSTGIAADSSNNVWVLDFQENEVSEFSPYPSQTILSSFDVGGPSQILPGQLNKRCLAVDDATGSVYVAAARGPFGEPTHIGRFDNGTLAKEWEVSGPQELCVAVDNSGGASQGTVYAADSIAVNAFSEEGIKIPFSAAESYVRGNEIVGSPTGPGAEEVPFGALDNIAVDSAGDIFVVDWVNDVVDEFESSGAFVQQFSGAAAGGFGSGYESINGIAIDPINGDVLVVDAAKEVVDEFDSAGEYLGQLTGTPTAPGGAEAPFAGLTGGIAVNSEGYVYVGDGPRDGEHDVIDIFSPQSVVGPKLTYEPVTDQTQSSATLNAKVDPTGVGAIEACRFEYGTNTLYKLGSLPCSTPSFTTATEVSAEISRLTPETTYHYRVVTEAGGHLFKGPDERFTPHHVVALTTEPATSVGYQSATLNGSFTGGGEETEYYFEWGPSQAYGHAVPLPPGVLTSPTGRTEVQVEVNGLSPVTFYDYRIVASNAAGTSTGSNQKFETKPLPPAVPYSASSEVHSDTAVLHVRVNPGGGKTTYHFEYVSATQFDQSGYAEATSSPIPDAKLGTGFSDLSAAAKLSALSAGTTYHWRVAATNVTATTYGPDQTLSTFPYIPLLKDSCPNAHVRQQTSAALLLDCRAYELVSAASTGGYDVESNLVAGQLPFAAYPEAENPPRVLYGVSDGGIPGTGDPTNKGLDPYVATRGETEWTTTYVGVPADNRFSALPFSSTPTGADAGLDAFAFGAPGGCSPCFGEGEGYTGIPVRLAGGELAQGMVPASGFQPGSAAQPDGYIATDLSADGTHFVFGSASQFAAGGNSNGVVSIYDRNLSTDETHVVSNAPAGTPLPCLQSSAEGECHSPKDPNGIAELGISADGGRILLGQKVSEDSDHNVYWHLYMNASDSERTVALTPATTGSTGGVLFDGMTADGSEVFFSSEEHLTHEDTSHSGADIFMWSQEGEEEGKPLTLISTGTEGAGNTASCDPAANSADAHWNTLGSEENCGALAIGGGGGVSSANGTIYFLSPQQLEPGKGVPNQPNLYLAAPDRPPSFVVTLSPNDPLVLDSQKEAEIRRTADFQVTPSGEFAAFTSTLPLTGYTNEGHSEVFRYAAATPRLDCTSCDPTNAEAEGSATLAADGLSLTEDGRVFFDSTDALTPRDLDQTQDVYEWEPQGTGTCGSQSPSFSETLGVCIGLISTGSSPFDSSLLSASADGTDVYFFTRDTLVPQDENGDLVKIYDARVEGGFPFTPEPPRCKSSDECHGPGSSAPQPPSIPSTASPGNGNLTTEPLSPKCRSGFVHKRGHCVRKSKTHKHHRRAGRRHRGRK